MEYIIFSGDRNYDKEEPVRKVLKSLDNNKHIILHGGW